MKMFRRSQHPHGRRRVTAAGMRAARIANSVAASDPRSYFYGDPVDITPEDAAAAIQEGNTDLPAQVAASSSQSDAEAVEKAQAYAALSPEEKAQVTMVPALAVWNAQVITNPVVGQISASNLNYNLTKNLNEMPFAGRTFSATTQKASAGDSYYADVELAITDATDTQLYGVPICTITIANSTLNTPVGGLVSLSYSGVDVSGNKWDTINDPAKSQYVYTFQRLNSTEPVRAIFVPFQVVATRTLPFMPVFQYSASAPKTIHIRLDGLTETDVVYVNVLGYASQELKEISTVYNLPAGQAI